MSSDCVVIVMAKAPVPGFAKTRLIPALGADGAAALALRLLDHAVEQALAANLGPVDLCCAPEHAQPGFAAQAKRAGLSLSSQVEGDLGARMTHALGRWLLGGRRVLLIGTDAPAVDAVMLRQAAQPLTDTDAVFVPALDGGYALVGLRRPAPELFAEMLWSTSSVMAVTRARLLACGLQHVELPAVADIDEPTDLVHLPMGWLA